MKKQLLRTSSKHLTDCINYFENGGAKWKQNTTV